MKQISLTKNEKAILKMLVEEGRISDTEISKGINLSQQRVNQLRTKLEDAGVIQGYMPIINFKKIGIRMFHFAGIKIMPSLWKKMSEAEIRKRLCDIPFLFVAFRIPAAEISYLLIFGFKNIKEEERFTKKVETELAGQMEVIWSYKAGVDNLMSYDSLNLVFHALQTSTDIRSTVENIADK